MKSRWEEGVIECPEFDLEMTLNSGQTFHWFSDSDGFSGCIDTIPFHLRQEKNFLRYSGYGMDNLSGLLRNYFAFDHDLEAIRLSCANHMISHRAAMACRGLRIMRQPHWECIASFILSPMKQVAHIRQMSLALRKSYGQPLQNSPVSAFPTPEVIATCSEEELRRCGLGFRAKGLLGTAKLIASGDFDPESLVAMSTSGAREALCTLPGIGRKVANCILLFSYERLNAVPVDVWISKILTSFRSPRSKKVNPRQLESYGEQLLGTYAGYIQQYLFHQARSGILTLPKPRTRNHKGRERAGGTVRA